MVEMIERTIIEYICPICEFKTRDKGEKNKHENLPDNPNEIFYELPENLLLREVGDFAPKGDHLLYVNKLSEFINERTHDREYGVVSLRINSPYEDCNEIIMGTYLSSLVIKRNIENGGYRTLTEEEFENAKKNDVLVRNGKIKVEKLVRTTPELEKLVQEGVKIG